MALAVLELAMQIKLASVSQSSACLCLPSADTEAIMAT